MRFRDVFLSESAPFIDLGSLGRHYIDREIGDFYERMFLSEHDETSVIVPF